MNDLLSRTTLLLATLVCQAIAITPEDIENLTLRSPLPTGYQLNAVTANGSTIVAGGRGGTIISSRNNGTTWISEPDLPLDNISADVLYLANNGSRYVAISNRWATSDDLKSWNTGVFSPFISPTDIAYGNGVFVLSGLNGEIHHSTDGETWSEASDNPAGTTTLWGIAFGNGAFVAGGDDGRLLRSTDGDIWTLVNDGVPGLTGLDSRFSYLSHANSLFIATGQHGLVYTSPDGTAWMQRDVNSPTANLKDAAYINGRYIFGNSLSSTNTTTDFTALEDLRFPSSGSADGIVSANGAVIAVGRSGFIGTTTDAMEWTERRQRLGRDFTTVSHGDGRFVIADVDGQVFHSPTGSIWTFAFDAAANLRTEIVFGGGQFAGITNSSTIHSDDGVSWTEEANDLPYIVDRLRYLNGHWVALGRSGQYAESADAIHWTVRDTGSTTWFWDIAHGAGQYVMVGSGDSFLTSPDGIAWTPRDRAAADTVTFTRVEFGNARFYAFHNGQPSTSTDGINWSVADGSPSVFTRNSGFDPNLGVFTLGTEGTVRYLADQGDLTSWTEARFPASTAMNGLVAGDGFIVGVGNHGLVLSNPMDAAGYNGWAIENFGTNAPASIRDADRDPDCDGECNLTEYVRGTNPNAANPPLPTSYSRDAFGTNLVWTQRAAPEGVQTGLEFTTDLASWRTTGVSVTATDNGDGTETITARVTGVPSDERLLLLRARWTLDP